MTKNWLDFKCKCGYTMEKAVPPGTKEHQCVICGNTVRMNWQNCRLMKTQCKRRSLCAACLSGDTHHDCTKGL